MSVCIYFAHCGLGNVFPNQNAIGKFADILICQRVICIALDIFCGKQTADFCQIVDFGNNF